MKKPATKPAPEVKPRADIQAILTVIGRLGPAYDEQGKPQRLDLRQTDLRGADLIQAHLEGAFLRGTHLEKAGLWLAHLKGAVLGEAHLEGAALLGANLEGVNLRETKGLTQVQIYSALNVDKDNLPDNLKPTDPDKAKPQ